MRIYHNDILVATVQGEMGLNQFWCQNGISNPAAEGYRVEHTS